jgi:prepilin-type N-terminal cleavage/methylation domain-containing protein
MLLRHQPRRIQAGFSLLEVVMAMFVFTIVVAGMVDGYVQMNRMATWASWSLAAQSVASEGLEQARAAQWNELSGPDQWPPTTNALGNSWPCIITNCSLDVPSTGQPIWVTNLITISTVSTAPPLRMIRSDCIWSFSITGQFYTNTVITMRAPDQ